MSFSQTLIQERPSYVASQSIMIPRRFHLGNNNLRLRIGGGGNAPETTSSFLKDRSNGSQSSLYTTAVNDLDPYVVQASNPSGTMEDADRKNVFRSASVTSYKS